MKCRLFLLLACLAAQPVVSRALAQLQACPVNINFASGDIAKWSAVTGLVGNSAKAYPAPNNGMSTVPEYNISTTGIQVITATSTDLYGSFPTIPTINGYAYKYAIQLGSTATSYDLHVSSDRPGGFTRSVSYTISVPAGPGSVPYTMTYAYAMVLENGTHNSNQQPVFKATLTAHDSLITCASPQYYLPTFNNAGTGNGGSATGATLDTATAVSNGFTNSPVAFLSHSGQNGNGGSYLRDVWTKGWTEVTFDLSAYRGQDVTLTFESDNCTPGAHFAYAYIALRNLCAGLQISGSLAACTNSKLVYSVPALASASYNWTVPAGWVIDSAANTNAITVTPGSSGGKIIAHEVNGCADLRDTIDVMATLPTIAGQVNADNTVCTGINSTVLTLGGQRGRVLNWLSSADGVKWNAIADSADSYTARNLVATTLFKALIQNGSNCSTDSSTAAIVTVNAKSKGGALSPASSSFCAGQTVNTDLALTGRTGSVLNWQLSYDKISWSNFSPSNTDTAYGVKGIGTTTYYRTVVQNGVCAADTSSPATVAYVSTPFPAAAAAPADTTICYGDAAVLHATISTGTSYTWTPAVAGSGTIPSLPYITQSAVKPFASGNYVLTVANAGCPNVLRDTLHVSVTAPITVFAGNDTSVVAGQPLQLHAAVSDPAASIFTWTPVTGLNFSTVANPVVTLPASTDVVTYQVKAANGSGCYGKDDIKVTIFKTAPEIFVPTGFTPNGDGHNDVFQPICVGISKLDYFRVYNRWGQLVFSTSQIGKGWDGTIGGLPQPSSSFVFAVQGTDYTGRPVMKKGTVVLVR